MGSVTQGGASLTLGFVMESRWDSCSDYVPIEVFSQSLQIRIVAMNEGCAVLEVRGPKAYGF